MLGKSSSNTAWLAGLFFELAVFNRALSEEETAKVREQMRQTYAAPTGAGE